MGRDARVGGVDVFLADEGFLERELDYEFVGGCHCGSGGDSRLDAYLFMPMRNSAFVFVFRSLWMRRSIASAAGTPCIARRRE